MAIVFFEGFNNSDSDVIKLDSSYWSTNDISKLSYVGGRTDNQIIFSNRPTASGLQYNTTLTLSNFTDPLVSHSGFGIGFYSNGYSLRTNTSSSPPPYAENLMSFYDNNGQALRIDIIKTTYNSTASVGFAVYQNNNLIETYDLKSPLGYSWNVYGQNDSYMIQQPSYTEIYIDPLNQTMAIRFSASNSIETYLLNSNNNIYTAINGFNNLSGITFSSTNNTVSNWSRSIDDLYLTAGNSLSECLLGYNTKIYRNTPSSDTSTQQWNARSGGSETSPSYNLLDDNDGDAGYIYSSTSGNICLYNMSNISEPAPSGVGGIKIINVVKKSNVDQDMNFINVMTSGDGGAITEIGGGHLVNSTSYNYKNTFLFNNPITSSEWTKQEINDMQLGVKII